MQVSSAQLPETLDGYRLIRFLGRGGFGEVWLCRSEAMGDYRALKWIPATNADRLEKEYESLLHYRRAAAALRSPALLAIEHVGRTDDGLYYIMPLADGVTNTDPAEPGWIPLSLAEKLRRQAEAPGWFSSSEVVDLMIPVLEGLQVLSEAGLVHRDVKPDNILFFHGKPCLGDISLLGEDLATITRRGTLGYAAPSWYLGGHPDMYGAAATLYSLLTGYPPDRMGKSSFLWPPGGESSLAAPERSEWKRLHAVVRRAIEDKVSERYVDFRTMAAAMAGRPQAAGVPLQKQTKKRVIVFALFALAAAAIGIVLQNSLQEKTTENPPSGESSPEPPGLTPDQKADYQALAGMVVGYIQDGNYANALASVEELLSTYPQSRTQPAYSVARAIALHGLGRVDEAKEELRREVNLSPNITAMTSRKDLWENMGDLEGAENDLSRVIERFGPATFPLFLRADVRAQREDFAGVQGDRETAYAANAADSEQRRLVDAMWVPLEEKYPGYGAFLRLGEAEPGEAATTPAAPSSPRPPKIVDMRGHFQSAREKVIEVLPAAVAPPRNGRVRLDLTERSESVEILRSYEARDYEKCLGLLDQRMSRYPELSEDRIFLLVRALVLKHLKRLDETKSLMTQAGTPPESGTMAELNTQLILLESLGWFSEAEKLVSAVLERVPETIKTSDRVIIYNHRARFRILSGDHAGALADEHAALALPPMKYPQMPSSKQETDQVHLNTIVMQWELLEQEFPPYAAYLEANGWPEPKPDHHDYRAED